MKVFYDKIKIIGDLNYYDKKEKSTSIRNAAGKRNIIQQLLQEYEVETVEDIQL